MLTLVTSDGKTWYKPGDTVEGRVEWFLDEPADAVEIRLFWHTSGKGTRDVGIVESLRFDAPEGSGHGVFRFRVPDGPYSFSGTLITLAWALEAVALPSGETGRLDLGVGPRPVEVMLR
jgi:hypothetical protein